MKSVMTAIPYIFAGLCFVIAYPVIYAAGFLYGIGKGVIDSRCKGDE